MKGRIAVSALLLAGCGHSSPTRFWTLDAVAPPSRSTAFAVIPVRVDAVHIPPALDRLELVEAAGGNRLIVHDFDHWSAPLGEAIRRVLTQDLIARLPAASVVFPAAPKPQGCRSLVVDILTLQPTGTGWVADVAWSVTGTTPDQRGQARLIALGAATPAGQAVAISNLAGRLADILVAVLQSPPNKQ